VFNDSLPEIIRRTMKALQKFPRNRPLRDDNKLFWEGGGDSERQPREEGAKPKTPNRIGEGKGLCHGLADQTGK